MTPQHAQHVLLVIFDGCRPDALTPANAPHVRDLMADGAYSLTAQTVMPSFTLPCHTSLFHSLLPGQHGVLSNEWTELPDGATSIVEVFSNHGQSTAAYYSWDQLRDLAPAGAYDLTHYRRLSEAGFEDLVQYTLASISDGAPNFAFVYLEASDAQGHRHGWMSPEYLAAVQRQDQIVGELLERYRESHLLDKTLVVVMADHGGHDFGHGTQMAEDMTIPIVFHGPGIGGGRMISEPISIVDVAPTILAQVNLPIPAAWAGRNISEALGRQEIER